MVKIITDLELHNILALEWLLMNMHCARLFGLKKVIKQEFIMRYEKFH